MTLLEGARGEEESIRRAIGVVGRSLAEGQRPEAIDRERWSVGGVQGAAGLKLALTGEGCRVEGVDASVAEIADEEVIAEAPEIGGRECQSPRRVELTLRRDATEQLAGGVEGVHEAVTLARHVVMFVGILQRVGHEDNAAEVLNPERRVPGGKIGIDERAGHLEGLESAVEHVDSARVEIGRVQARSGGRAVDGNPFVHRPASRIGHDRHYGRSPEGGDGAVLAGEDETGRACAQSIVHDEARATVEHDAGRCALLTARARHREGIRNGAGPDVIEGGETGPIVGDPPRCGRARHEPPGVDHPGIGEARRDGAVRDEVQLKIELSSSGADAAEDEDDRKQQDRWQNIRAHVCLPSPGHGDRSGHCVGGRVGRRLLALDSSFLVIDSAFATMAQGRVAAVLVHASALTARHNNALQAVGIDSWGGRGPSLADSARGPEGHPVGDRRWQVLMLAILTADPALHLAACRNYLTGPLFRQIVAHRAAGATYDMIEWPAPVAHCATRAALSPRRGIPERGRPRRIAGLLCRPAAPFMLSAILEAVMSNEAKETPTLVRRAVKNLLAHSPAFGQLPTDARGAMADDLIRVSTYLAAP